MHKVFTASSCLAAIMMVAGCAANQGSSLVPASVAPTGDAAVATADYGHGFGPDTGSSVVEFKFASSGFYFVVPDFAGNEWFGSADPLALVEIDEHTGHFTQYNLPASYSGPYGLAMNPAHNVLWFTDPGSNAIGYMNLLNHTVGEFTIPTHHSNPEGITAGPGNAMWFTEFAAGKIGKIDTVTHAFTEYNVPSPSGPTRITLGPDGALWFSNRRSIGRITTKGHVHVYSIGQNDPTGITTGPDGGIWFTGESDHNGSMLGRIDPYTHLRKIAKYSNGDGGNADLTVRDSDFWMTRYQGNRIDRFDHVTHIIHSRVLPHGYVRPFGIALGSDNQLWFVNAGSETMAIGKLCPDLTQGQCKGAF
jgi:streptogramin lyase